MRVLVAGIVAMLSLAFILGSELVGGEKAKYTISQVMKKAMAGGLCKKVASGKASDEERKELVALFTALAQNDPPKGDKAAFKEKANALLKAAKDNDGAALGKAANCAACHKEHKG
jgi:cytochrome c